MTARRGAEPAVVLDARCLARQELLRPGASVPDGRIVFRDPSSGRAWGALAGTGDTRRPGDPRLLPGVSPGGTKRLPSAISKPER